MPNGTYILSGCPSGGSGTTYYINAVITKNGSALSLGQDFGSGVEITLNGDDNYNDKVQLQIACNVRNGYTASNLLFKPMLRLVTDTDSTYQPYAQTNKQLTDSKVSYEDNAITGVHNLLPYPYNYTTKSENNVTFTDNGDGTITIVTGTGGASADTRFYFRTLADEFNLSNGIPYTLSDNSPNGQNLYTSIALYNGSTYTNTAYSTKNGDNTFVLSSSPTRDRVNIYCTVKSGAELNLTYKPLLRVASDSYSEYTQYAMTNKELTDKVVTNTAYTLPAATSSTLGGVKVSSSKGFVLDDNNILTFARPRTASISLEYTGNPITIPGKSAKLLSEFALVNSSDMQYLKMGVPISAWYSYGESGIEEEILGIVNNFEVTTGGEFNIGIWLENLGTYGVSFSTGEDSFIISLLYWN